MIRVALSAILYGVVVISGCISFPSQEQADGAFEVRFPAEGATATYEEAEKSNRRQEFVVAERVDVTRGDGQTVAAIRVRNIELARQFGQAVFHYIEVESRNQVRYQAEKIAEEFFLNFRDQFLGSQFWGRDLRRGDHWQAPYFFPSVEMSFEVLSASHSGAVVVNQRPAIPPDTANGIWKTELTFRYNWKSGHIFADTVEVIENYSRDGEAVIARYELVSSSEVAEQDRPKYQAFGFREPTHLDWSRLPPLDGHSFRVPYEEFRRYVENHQGFNEYLSMHSRAFAARVSYLEVKEQESSSTIWRALFRDASREAYVVSLVRRCFDDEVHQTLYGKCRDSVGYFGEEEGAQQVSQASDLQKPLTVGLPAALSPVLVLRAGFSIDKIEWLAFPQPGIEGESLWKPGPPGFLLGNGSIVGTVDYSPPEPRGSHLGDSSNAIHVDALHGWVLAWRQPS